jgi:hypothetical protein
VACIVAQARAAKITPAAQRWRRAAVWAIGSAIALRWRLLRRCGGGAAVLKQ